MTGPTSSRPQQLLEELQTLLSTAAQADDLQVLLSPQATALTQALWDSHDAPENDLDICHALGWWHWLRSQVLPEGEGQRDLRTALALLELVYLNEPEDIPEALRPHFSQTTPTNHPDRPGFLSDLGGALQTRARRTGNTSDLDRAIDVLDQAVTIAPANHPDRPAYLSNLGGALQTRAWRTGNTSDLDRAVDVLDQAVTIAPANHPDRPGFLSNLGGALQTRARRTGNTSDLDRAIDVLDQAVTTNPTNHPDRPAYLSNLSNALRDRYGRTGHTTVLDRAITAIEQAVTTTPTKHPDRPGYLSNLGGALQTRARRTGNTSDLDRAIDVLDQSVTITPANHPERPGFLSDLGAALQTRYGRTGDTTVLDRAVDVLDLAVTSAPANHPERPGFLSDLGAALQTRYGNTGDTTVLDRAVDVLDLAVTSAPANHPERPGFLSDLGAALQTRSVRTGDTTVLDRAVDVLDQAVTITPANHADRARHLSNLGAALQTRSVRTGDTTDLDRAVDVLDQAVATTPANHTNLTGYLSNLGNALRTRYERTGNTSDLDRAIEVLDQAVTSAPTNHPNRAGFLSNLGNALQTRYGHTGNTSDRDHAIDAFEQAATNTPTNHPNRAGILSNLGNALRTRSGGTGDAVELDRAVDVLDQALTTTPANHPNRAGFLSNLGAALQARSTRTGDATDLDRALSAFHQGALVVSAPPMLRAKAARGWGQCAESAGHWSDAVHGFGVAVELLGQVVPGWLERADQEDRLSQIEGVGSEAAAACLQAGLPERAVELFEQGRGVLFARTLDTRTDLTDLAERHPDLADTFENLSRQLSRPTTDMTGMYGGTATPETGSRDARDRRRAHDQMVALLDRIRGLDGFTKFLLPRPVADLLPAQGAGALVLVNIAELRSDALILTSTGIQTIPLPYATPAAVAERVNRLRAALADLRITNPPEHDVRIDAETHIESVLGWLWDTITEPVLTHLGHTGTPTEGQPWPRVWWCPSGPLAFLPLHAAGRPTQGGSDAVLDRVVSSTIPTIRALQQAQARTASPTTSDDDRVLVAAMPTTPDTDDPDEAALPGVAAETAIISALLLDQVDVLGLPDTPAATFDSVTANLPTHKWVHFACHARTRLDDPSQSALLLTDHRTRPLTVTDLSALRLDRAELAVLSACSTALTGTRLPDEPIHLAAACQLAGYRHVIATLWPLDDGVAVYATGIIYRHLMTTDDGSPAVDADQAAAATHHATRALRHQLPDQPSLWAMLTHTGP